MYLREQGNTSFHNLATFKRGGCWVNITMTYISRALKFSVRILGPSLGFTLKDLSAQYLFALGAMALICSGVDTNIIKLVGQWFPDEML